MAKGIGGHQSARAVTSEWATPPDVLAALGGAAAFDLDPCAMVRQPWACARESFTVIDNGLRRAWRGDVYMNPPYGAELGAWLARLADHRRGVALIFARTETDAFQTYVWAAATAVLFLRGRLHFHYPDGSRARFNGGAPSVLVAYGDAHAERLLRCGLPGYFAELKNGRLT